jgi:glutathione peroxidase
MLRYLLIGTLIVLALVALYFVRRITGSTVLAQTTQPAVKTTALTHTVTDIDGQPYDLRQLKGNVVLVVNVASKCGFTPQYKGLETLYQKYKGRGLVVIGFPANDFGSQEPGTEAEIKEFCSTTYGVTFPMMSKIVVRGAEKHAIFRALTEGTGPFAGEVGWNFTKFLIAPDGETMLGRFGSSTSPTDAKLVEAIEAALPK